MMVPVLRGFGGTGTDCSTEGARSSLLLNATLRDVAAEASAETLAHLTVVSRLIAKSPCRAFRLYLRALRCRSPMSGLPYALS